ncbi:MAG TPA: ROK family protein [Polyangiales bacterium]
MLQAQAVNMRIGLDLGGTKIEAIVLDASGGERYRTRVATPAHDYDALLGALCTLVGDAESRLGIHASVGIGTPGALSRATGLIKNSNTACLNGRALDRDLGRLLARPIRIANDANCFALSEAIDGAGQGADVVFGAILGTGCGGGVVVARRALVGVNAIAGEWGHNPLPWPTDSERPGPACYCGRSGCIETFVSGTGLCRDYQEHSGLSASGAQIAAAAASGEPYALAALERYCDRLARGLGSVINLLDPDVIVLGGGASKLEAIYTQVPVLLPKYVFSDRVDTRLCRATHGDASGVRGAAWLWSDSESAR